MGLRSRAPGSAACRQRPSASEALSVVLRHFFLHNASHFKVVRASCTERLLLRDVSLFLSGMVFTLSVPPQRTAAAAAAAAHSRLLVLHVYLSREPHYTDSLTCVPTGQVMLITSDRRSVLFTKK